MIRSNATARRARAVLGAVIVAAALSACGSEPAHQGAAAVVGGDRITIAAVESRVSDVRTATAALPNVPQPERAGLVRLTVDRMILDRVLDRALADHQLEVTATEVADLRAAVAQKYGGESQAEQALLVAESVPADGIEPLFREYLGRRKLAAAEGQTAGTDAGEAAVQKVLAQAGTELKIEVNPRYGRWDPNDVALVDAVEDWLPRNATAA